MILAITTTARAHSRWLSASSALFFLTLTATDAHAFERLSTIKVGSQRQLFIDDKFFESSSGIQLVVNSPKPTGERLIKSEHPWESLFVGDYTMVFEEEGRLRMWYESRDRDDYGGIAYAYSDDHGATWIKPMLGIADYKGSKENNFVMTGVHACHVFKNRPGSPPDEQWGMFCLLGKEKGTRRSKTNRCFVSPDGLHWNEHGAKPFWDMDAFSKDVPRYINGLDSENVIFWDARIDKYVFYPRLDVKPLPNWKFGHFLREYGRLESDTLGDFQGLQIVFGPDEQDPHDMDFYTTSAMPYSYAADVYLMFPAAYHHFKSPPHPPNDGSVDVQFAASRDGIKWERYDRQPIIPLGPKGSGSEGAIYAGWGLSRHGDKLSLYYTPHDITHGVYKERGWIGGDVTRAIYRLDGFVSVDAGPSQGSFTTPPLEFTGDCLALNIDTGQSGKIKVEVLDEQSKPIKGLSGDDAEWLKGDSTKLSVKWKSTANLAAFQNAPVRLRVTMQDCKLYAFEFVE